MLCPKCDSDNIQLFNEKIITCIHCDGTNTISTYACEDCGSIWNATNGVIETNYILSGKEAKSIFDVAVENHKSRPVDKKAYMEDMVHTCIRCNAIAYEVEEDQYSCPECGFTWETLH